jgi:putative nucleotidyltransferase with HDIG domain
MNPTEINDRYNSLLHQVQSRKDQLQSLVIYLKNKTPFETSPASTRFHLAYKHGLLEHSVNVAETLLKLRDLLAPDISKDSCIICALFHDVGKAGTNEFPYYIDNPSEWHKKNRGIFYNVNSDIVHMDIASRSLFIVSKFIDLTEEEAQAIRYHDGQYIDENKSVAHKETKLTRLLQYADNWAGGVLEK